VPSLDLEQTVPPAAPPQKEALPQEAHARAAPRQPTDLPSTVHLDLPSTVHRKVQAAPPALSRQATASEPPFPSVTVVALSLLLPLLPLA